VGAFGRSQPVGRRIGVIEQRLVHRVTVKEPKLLVMVVVVEPHPAGRAQSSYFIEELRTTKDARAVPRG
jgi:hypothetical protein